MQTALFLLVIALLYFMVRHVRITHGRFINRASDFLLAVVAVTVLAGADLVDRSTSTVAHLQHPALDLMLAPALIVLSFLVFMQMRDAVLLGIPSHVLLPYYTVAMSIGLFAAGSGILIRLMV